MIDETAVTLLPAWPLTLFLVPLSGSDDCLEVLASDYMVKGGWLRFWVTLDARPLEIMEVMRVPMGLVDTLPTGFPVVNGAPRSVIDLD